MTEFVKFNEKRSMSKRNKVNVKELVKALDANKIRNEAKAVVAQSMPKSRTRRNRRKAVVAVGQQQNMVSTESTRLRGTDRFLHIPDVSTFAAQTIIVDQLFTSKSIPRLALVSDVYQKYRVKKLHFRVAPQISTAVSGGYVVGFVNDAAYVLPSGPNGLNALTAQRGTCTMKWWEDSTVVAPVSGNELYTKVEESQERFSSPGRFILASDGKATSAGSLTVFIEWEVELLKPTLETQTEAEETLAESLCQTDYVVALFQAGMAGNAIGYACAADQLGNLYSIRTAFPMLPSGSPAVDYDPEIPLRLPWIPLAGDNCFGMASCYLSGFYNITPTGGSAITVMRIIATGTVPDDVRAGIDDEAPTTAKLYVPIWKKDDIFNMYKFRNLEEGTPLKSAGTEYLCKQN